ncbi:MAG: tRNA1(Val) (adenine(37)-N6)-methyltransferase [Pseudomonadota bacterium]|nr:tRNA1(Val) (adenine(37)-N6)-methyltransferase [Pseudomonadota bacterium]
MAKTDGAEPADSRRRNGETVDELLGGRLRVIQGRRGYRFSLDALLLANFVRMRKGASLLDLGTGSAVIPMLLCRRWGCARAVGVEIQSELADMARRSLELNALEGTIAIVEGDVREAAQLVPARSFDVVTCNPPYRRLRSGRINPLAQKARARHELCGGLDDFLRAAAYAVCPDGHVFAIYPARRLAELIFRMRRHRLEPKRLRMVHSRKEMVGEFVLAEGRPGAGEELTVLPPLFIYGAGQEYTAAMEEIFSDLCAFPENDDD